MTKALKVKYKLKIALALTFMLVISVNSDVYANTATLEGTSTSIALYESSTTMSGYPVSFLFTTYDGSRYSMPYYYDSTEGIIYYNRELKRVGAQYKTDYFCISISSIFDYGEIAFNLPTVDLNSNGIDDICEKDRPVNTSMTGNWYSYDGTSGNIGGNLNRSANSQQGTYSATIYSTVSGDVQISGNWYVTTMSGTIDYEEPGGSISANYSLDVAGSSFAGALSSTYEIINQNSIRIFSKDEFPATVFMRDGNRYTAIVTLSDGGTDTFWPDYQKWLYIIKDNNDADNDGIPDLSDTVDNTKFTITATTADGNGSVEPASVSKERGQLQTFVAYPNSGYHVKDWKMDGVVVQNGGNEYTLSNIQSNTAIVVSFERFKAMPWIPLLLGD